MQSLTTGSSLRASSYKEQLVAMKDLKKISSSFRVRSRIVELARFALYFVFFYFGADVMLDHLPKFWVVVLIVLGIAIIDWTLRRLWLLPAAELEIQRKAEQDVLPNA